MTSTSPVGLVVRVAMGVLGLAVIVVALTSLLPHLGLPALWIALMGGVLLAAAVFEVGRYRATASAAEGTGGASSGDGGRFQRTDEVFVDPTTGVTTRVWFDPRSGERRYEPEA